METGGLLQKTRLPLPTNEVEQLEETVKRLRAKVVYKNTGTLEGNFSLSVRCVAI